MGCGEFLVKTILFVSNFIFALAGLSLLGVAIAAQLKVGSISSIGDWNVEAAPIFSMVIGGIVFVISFFGCCGAIRESNCMLVTYAIFMLLLMIAKIALAVFIFVSLDSLLEEVPKWLNTAFQQNNLETFHEIEETFKCCGTTGAVAYLNVSLPDSCCATPPCVPIVNAYEGCNIAVDNFLNTFGMAIGVVAIVVASIELVAVVFGLCLANHVRNKSRRARY